MQKRKIQNIQISSTPALIAQDVGILHNSSCNRNIVKTIRRSTSNCSHTPPPITPHSPHILGLTAYTHNMNMTRDITPNPDSRPSPLPHIGIKQDRKRNHSNMYFTLIFYFQFLHIISSNPDSTSAATCSLKSTLCLDTVPQHYFHLPSVPPASSFSFAPSQSLAPSHYSLPYHFHCGSPRLLL